MLQRVALVGMFVLVFIAARQSFAGPVFDIHNEARGCQDIPALDQALATDDAHYFSGWNSKDFTKAEDWAEACKAFGSRQFAATRLEQIEAVYDHTVRPKAVPVSPIAPLPPTIVATSSPERNPANIAADARALANRLKAENAAAAAEADPPPRPVRKEPQAAYVAPSFDSRQWPSHQADVNESNLTGHGHYFNSDGDEVHSPSETVDGSIPDGATAECRDGTYSFSRHHRGTCSHHGGVESWLN